MIKITNLNKYFYRHKQNEIHVINNTSIEFPETGLVAILGESGCGKTTLMNVLGGLDRFNSGTIEIDDYQFNKYQARKIDRMRNEKIGYIFQNYLLLPQETVYNNLMLTLNMYKLSQKEKDERINYVLQQVGMLKQKRKKASELSGGQQQRVSIARALVKSPSLILADEPTGNLDEKNTIQIMNIIKKISEKTLVILVSHEQSIAKSYADYIIEICDGKIISSHQNLNNSGYTYQDDLVLHLLDYKEKKYCDENIDLSFYSKETSKLELKIVYENGKYFLKSPTPNLVIIDSNSEMQMVEDHKTIVNVEEKMNLNSFHLEPLTYYHTPRLSFKEKRKIAIKNLKNIKRRSIFLYFSLFVISCLTLWCIQSMASARVIDKKNLASSDSHLYTVNIEKGDAQISSLEFLDIFENIYNDFTENFKELEVVPSKTYNIQLNYESFTQIKSQDIKLSNVTFSTLNQIKEDTLIYGKMPSNPSEILVDTWVIEKLLATTNLKNQVPVSSFVNQKITLEIENIPLTISGIVQTNNNTIYANQWLLLAVYPANMKAWGRTIIPLSEYKKYPGADQNLTLNPNEIYTTNIITHGYTENIHIMINEDEKMKYDVKEEITTVSCPFKIIVPDELDYELVLASAFLDTHDSITIYCENQIEQDKVKAYFDKMNNEYQKEEVKKATILHKSIYDESLEPYYNESRSVIRTRMIILGVVLVIAIMIIYFSMRSFAIKNIYEIGVYRANGVSKGSIIFIYGLEIMIISFFSTIVGSFIFYLLMNFISEIPVLMGNFGISFVNFLISSFGLFAINILVGILPILLYMRLTPSEILSKYDI